MKNAKNQPSKPEHGQRKGRLLLIVSYLKMCLGE